MHSQFNNISWVGFSSPNQEIRYVWIGPYLRWERLKTWIYFEQIINLNIKSLGFFSLLLPLILLCLLFLLFFFFLSPSLLLSPSPASLFPILFTMSFTYGWISLLLSVFPSHNISSKGSGVSLILTLERWICQLSVCSRYVKQKDMI